ncbi:MAG TPA: hypothetical protein VNS09_12730 [Solirubrobacter sp.]|nr:hypothetical protein [Solirubrobacter sp.]
MATIQIDAGTLEFSAEDQTATGLLVPFGVEARSNIGRFTVQAGAFEIPADLTGASLNLEHERERVAGGMTRVWEQPESGIYASFKFADTPLGRAAFADARSGKRKHLSVEAADVKIRDGQATSGRVFAAALVEEPAFAGATLLAAKDTPERTTTMSAPRTTGKRRSIIPASTLLAETAPGEEIDAEVEATDEETVEVSADALPDEIVVETPEGDVVYTPDPDADPEEVSATVQARAARRGAPVRRPVPATLLGGAPRRGAAKTRARGPEPRQIFAAINRARLNAATSDDLTLLASANPRLSGDPATLFAALSDVKVSGAGSLPIGGHAIQPSWVGQLYQGLEYERQYVPLGKTGTDISIEGKKGYKVHRGTSGAPVDTYAPTSTWAGNKSAIASGTGWTQESASTLARFAWGADIAREFSDLPGGAEVLEAFFKLIAEDYLIWSDDVALDAWQIASGAPVDPATSKYSANYPAAVGQVIQGILAVKARKSDYRRDLPTFGILNEIAYEQIAYAAGGEENMPAFVKLVLSTNADGQADGDVQLVLGETGIDDTASVIVGAQRAIEFDELPGGPLHIDALEIAKGGIDRAIHGYLQTFEVRPEAVVRVGTPAARANTTAYTYGQLVKASAVVYRCVAAGTSAGSAPSAPAVGATVTDGTVTWLRLA